MLKKLKKKIKNKCIEYITRNILVSITEDELLRQEGRVIMCRGEAVPAEIVERIKSEADFIRHSHTYELLKKDLQYLAQDCMFNKSETFDDMLFGKAQLYVIDILDKKLKTLSN